MVREKRDHRDDDRVESELSDSAPQDEGSAEQENQASDERLDGEPSETSSEQSPDADDVGDVAPEKVQDSPPIAEPTSGAKSDADNFGQTGSEIDPPVELPPPEPLPQNAIAPNSLIGPPADTAGISFGESSSEASAAGAETSIPDFGESVPGPSASDLGQPVFFDNDPTRPPTVPPPEVGDNSPLDSQPGSPSIRQLSPLFLQTGSGERRVQKRLEIEVEVTVTNQERIALISSNKTLRTFADLAHSSVYKVAQDLRTFRESYRDAWGRRF